MNLMQQARLVDVHRFVLENIPLPKPANGEVLIRVSTAGICGSDLHAYEGKHPFVHPPIVLGHEFSGTIHELGPQEVEEADCKPKLVVGQRVTVEPSITCGACYNCLQGRYNICDRLQVIGSQISGGYADFVKVPSANVIVLDEEMSFQDGAMIEPLAVGVHAVRRAGVQSGQTVLVIGGGTIGLLLAQVVQACGADVIVSDLIDSRLDIARRLGVKAAINPQINDLVTELARFAPYGADHIFECVGSPFTLRQSIQIARKGSRIIIVGVAPGNVSLPVHLIQDRELELIGDLMYVRSDYMEAMRLVRERRVNLDALKGKVFPLERIEEAFQYVLTHQADTMKVFLAVEEH